MAKSIEQRVADGIKLLDEKVPDWRSKIDLATLKLSHPDRCILGQLGADRIFLGQLGASFSKGLSLVGLKIGDSANQAAYGFESEYDGDEYDELQEEWESALIFG